VFFLSCENPIVCRVLFVSVQNLVRYPKDYDYCKVDIVCASEVKTQHEFFFRSEEEVECPLGEDVTEPRICDKKIPKPFQEFVWRDFLMGMYPILSITHLDPSNTRVTYIRYNMYVFENLLRSSSYLPLIDTTIYHPKKKIQTCCCFWLDEFSIIIPLTSLFVGFF